MKFEGRNGIAVRVLLDSVSQCGVRLITFEWTYPRIIHAEVMTHKSLSKNAASSRAIPFAKMKEQLTGMPVRFGANQSGMQDAGDHTELICGRLVGDGNVSELLTPQEAWEEAKQDALFWSEAFHDAGYHKQVYNRLTEPFQMMKTIITGTEWENFFWLRNDSAADPTLQELAKWTRMAYDLSTPKVLKKDEWHLPLVDTSSWNQNHSSQGFFVTEETGPLFITLDDAKKVSAARCAAVSFRNTDYTLQKSLEVYDRLVGSERKHASAFEHQATPIVEYDYSKWDSPLSWRQGISHLDRDQYLWSGNLREWIQYRKLIPGENYTGEK